MYLLLNNAVRTVFKLHIYIVDVPSFNNIQLICNFTDASSSNEAVHLQQRLKSLSTELLTLRNRLHVGPTAAGTGGGVTGNAIVNSVNNNTIGNGNSNNNTIHSSTTTVNNTTSSPVIPITNSSKLNNKVRHSSVSHSDVSCYMKIN